MLIKITCYWQNAIGAVSLLLNFNEVVLVQTHRFALQLIKL